MNPDRRARTTLPIPYRPTPGLTTYDAKGAEIARADSRIERTIADDEGDMRVLTARQ